MEYFSLLKLVDLLDVQVKKNGAMAEIRTGPGVGLITTEIALHCCIRWLSGGAWQDVRLTARISRSSLYEYAHRCVAAINSCTKLQYKFPTTASEIANAALGFKSISSHNIFTGCVAAVDGLLIRTEAPWKKRVPNIKSYYSGHYKSYGINVQAACDYKSRFVYMTVKCPGGCNDSMAYRNTSLPDKVESLPPKCFTLKMLADYSSVLQFYITFVSMKDILFLPMILKQSAHYQQLSIWMK